MFSGILAEESEKLTWAKEHPELAEPPFALEDHPLSYGYQAGFSMYSYEIKYLAASYGVFDYTEDDRNWVLCAPAVSGFLSAALAYEAVFCFSYGPEEFYCITEAEAAFIQENLKKFPYSLEKWAGGITASGIPPAYRPFPSP